MPEIIHDDRGAEILSNNMLDSFFAFDPYLLKRSGLKIQPHYREYQELSEREMGGGGGGVKSTGEQVDDFLGDERQSPTKNDRFSYGTSPGYKF